LHLGQTKPFASKTNIAVITHIFSGGKEKTRDVTYLQDRCNETKTRKGGK
jgi:hypothetical protein